jgi:DNA-binding transcriptional regulator YdaS (Cro superfamily)
MNLANYINGQGRGALAELSRAINAHAPDVSRWASGDRPVPADRCPEIERATNGAVRCEDLRPDVNWSVLRSQPKTDLATQQPAAPAQAKEEAHG